MENPGELHSITPEGGKVYSTENQTTSEEKKLLLKKQQELDGEYSLWLRGKGPNPYEKRKDNVIEFPKTEEKRKAA